MIPRRRIPIEAADFAEWLRSLLKMGGSARDAVAVFEQAMTEYLGCRHARATCSGRDAIELALDGLGATDGDEIIVPAYTLGELMPLLQSRGLRPIPADIEADTFNINPDHVARRITSKTRVILATHLLGAPCDIERICALAGEHDIGVIEDCAHGLGASVGGKKVGTFGDAAIFSHEVNKAVPTYGGGMLVTNRHDIAQRAADELDARPESEWPTLKKTFSSWIEEGVIRSPFYPILVRILFSKLFAAAFEKFYRGSHDKLRKVKAQYTGFQARLGRRRLAKLDDRNARLNERWTALARALPDGFEMQVRDRVGTPAFYNFVALSPIDPAELRQRVMRYGVDIGIGSEVMDDTSKQLGFDDCPMAERVAGRAVLLPLYEGLSDRRFRKLVRALDAATNGGAR